LNFRKLIERELLALHARGLEGFSPFLRRWRDFSYPHRKMCDIL